MLDRQPFQRVPVLGLSSSDPTLARSHVLVRHDITHDIPLPRIRISGRSFLALTLTPEAPLEDWLSALDHQIARSAGFFAGKPIILDLGMLDAEAEHLAGLLPALKERGIRVIGIEGGDRTWPALADWDWPENFAGGRASAEIAIPEDSAPEAPAPAP